MNKILLFYKYIDIDQPEAIKQWQLDLCKSLNLTGRIIVASEGINGTLGGTNEETDTYVSAMLAHPLFGDIDFKTSAGSAADFPRLSVKVKQEITRLGVDPATLKAHQGGKHLTPEQTHDLLSNPPQDLIILDTRNDYEARVGRFEGAVCPPVRYFREFPQYVDENLDQFKDKEVLMYCTGGIRCERASAYLKVKGIAKEVYQIQGGIHRYIEQFPDGHFRGKNYVFDNRMLQKANDDIMTACDWCIKPCDTLTSCINSECDKQFICCAPCLEPSQNTCSFACKDLVAQNAVRLREMPRNTLYHDQHSL